jgi:hypothetical protein
LADEASLLLALPGANERLEMSTVDVLDYANLSELFYGCSGVFYVPSPNYDINGARDYPVTTTSLSNFTPFLILEYCFSVSPAGKPPD